MNTNPGKPLFFGRSPVNPAYWYLEAPLYHREDYKFENFNEHGFSTYRQNLLDVIYPRVTIDVFCPKCQRETVFSPPSRKENWNNNGREIVVPGVHYAHFRCSRGECRSDLYYVFTIDDGVVTKIGQVPSIGDLIKPHLRKYSPVLGADQIADWQRAVGLRAHGIGAGSYVYLRRIIESLVREAASVAITDGKFPKEEFDKARWKDRIRMLSGYVPNYLMENAHVYSVLSLGVHELTESECADYFEVMHTSLEVICEDRLAELERRKKAASGAQALQKVMRALAARGEPD